MQKVDQLLTTFPTPPTSRKVEWWIKKALKKSGENGKKRKGKSGVESSSKGRELTARLTEFEATFFRELVRQYGEPRDVEFPEKGRQEYEGPNPPLLLLWELNEKYNFYLRLHTEIIDGILRYAD